MGRQSPGCIKVGSCQFPQNRETSSIVGPQIQGKAFDDPASTQGSRFGLAG